MSNFLHRKTLMACAGVLLVSTLVGCETLSSSSDEGAANGKDLTPARQEAIVAKRFQERWDAVMAGDYEKAYSFLSPATRKIVTAEQYRESLSKGQFKKVALDKVSCDNDVCIVKFFMTYDFGKMRDITTPTGEKWFFESGQAWFNIPRD